jgi:hypothetical protein
MRFAPRFPPLPERLDYVHWAHLCGANYPIRERSYEIILNPQTKIREKLGKIQFFNTFHPT